MKVVIVLSSFYLSVGRCGSPEGGGSRPLLLGPLESGRLGLLADLADQDGAVLALALEPLAARAVDVGAFPPCPIGLHVELASDGLGQQLLERGALDFALRRRDDHRRRLCHPLVTEHGVELKRDAVGRIRHAEALREFRQDVDRDDDGVGPRLPSGHGEPAAGVGDAAAKEVGAVETGIQSEDGGDAQLGHVVTPFCVCRSFPFDSLNYSTPTANLQYQRRPYNVNSM